MAKKKSRSGSILKKESTINPDMNMEIDIMKDGMDLKKSKRKRKQDFERNYKKLGLEELDRIALFELYIIRQNHPYHVWWDLFIILLAIWNSYTIPLDVAFEPEAFRSPSMLISNYIIDSMFLLDIILNFRTSYQDLNGDEVLKPKEIAKNYITAGRFWIDTLSTIPFDLITSKVFNIDDTQTFQILSMLKLFRVLRLSRIIAYMNSTNDVKLSLRLFKLCFFLVLYIHCTACLLYYVARFEEYSSWIPAYNSYYTIDTPFEEESLGWKYLLTFYYSLLTLTGNDIYPRSGP